MYWRCFGCLPEDEPVLLDNGGIIAAGDVVSGHVLIDVSGRPTLATAIHKHVSGEPIIEVEHAAGTLRATANHDMLAVFNPVSERGQIRSDYRKPTKIYQLELRHLNTNTWLPFPTKLGTYIPPLISLKHLRRESTTIKQDEPWWAWMLGIYCAEGSVSSAGRVVVFSLGHNEGWIAEELHRLPLGKVTTHVSEHGISVTVSSTEFAKYVEATCGAGCENKHAPSWLFNQPNPGVVAAWLQGVMTGDARKSDWVLRSTSRSLVAASFRAAVTCGLFAKFNKTEHPIGKRAVYQMRLLAERSGSLGLQHAVAELSRISHGGVPNLRSRTHSGLAFVEIGNEVFYLSQVRQLRSVGQAGRDIVVDITTSSGTFCLPSAAVHNCGATGDIFTAAYHLEGLPLSGPEFLHENVYVLANRFHISYEPVQLTEEELYIMKLKQVYRHAADTLVEFSQNRDLINERGWSPKLCFDMRVGVVSSWEEFKSRLMNKGDYTAKFLQEAGIYETLFNPFVITFTMFDEFGNPVGFSARDSRWGKVQNIKKFRTTEVRIPIFKKMEILYGLHLIKTKPIEVTLVEGFADVLTPLQAGLEGFVGYLMSEPTDEQIALLQKHGKNDVTLAADYDAESRTGQEKTEKMIDEVLSGKKNLRLKIIDLSSTTTPDKSTDPDTFLRVQADPKMAWAALPKQDAFQWRLGRMRGEPPEVTCKKMINLIMNEPQRARQEVMLKTLSTETGIRVEALQSDLDSRLYETDRRRRDEAVEIREDVFRQLKHADPCKADEIFDSAAKKIKALKRDTRAIVTLQTSIEMVDSIQTKFLNKGEGLPGMETGWRRFDERMGGLSKEDCFMVIGGIPHSGKTSWFSALAWHVAKHNEDACVLYLSVDDSMAQIYPKFIGMETGIPITWAAQPRRFLKSKEEFEKLAAGWTEVKRLIQLGRLEVRDVSFGNSVNYLESWIEERKRAYKNRQIIAILDNFHKIAEGADSIRERFRNASEHLKIISQSGRTTVVVTAELLKSTDRKNPQLSDLMETNQLEHDATIAGVCHCEMQADPQTDITWLDEEDPVPEDRRKPIVEIRILKNKNIDGAYKGPLKFYFDPKKAIFREMAEDIPVEVKAAGEPVRSAQATLKQGTLGIVP